MNKRTLPGSKVNETRLLKPGIMLFKDIDGNDIYHGDCLDRINNSKSGLFTDSKLTTEMELRVYERQWAEFRLSGINVIDDPESAVRAGYYQTIEHAIEAGKIILELNYYTID